MQDVASAQAVDLGQWQQHVTALHLHLQAGAVVNDVLCLRRAGAGEPEQSEEQPEHLHAGTSGFIGR